MKQIILSLLVLACLSAYAGNKKDIAALAERPKNTVEFPLEYIIALPRLDTAQWDKDYNWYARLITPAVKKKQQGLAFTHNGIHTWWILPAANSHAQLDTATRITNKNQLKGTWRAICNRKVMFTDSAYYPTGRMYRNNTLKANLNADDLFTVIDDDGFEMYVKEEGKSKFKKMISSNYALEAGRYLMLYKILKAGSGIMQAGIDKEGHLILQSTMVTENRINGRYITYIADAEQFIFEKVDQNP